MSKMLVDSRIGLDRNELPDSGTSLQLPDSFGQGGKRKRGRKLMPNRKESGNQSIGYQ